MNVNRVDPVFLSLPLDTPPTSSNCIGRHILDEPFVFSSSKPGGGLAVSTTSLPLSVWCVCGVLSGAGLSGSHPPRAPSRPLHSLERASEGVLISETPYLLPCLPTSLTHSSTLPTDLEASRPSTILRPPMSSVPDLHERPTRL